MHNRQATSSPNSITSCCVFTSHRQDFFVQSLTLIDCSPSPTHHRAVSSLDPVQTTPALRPCSSRPFPLRSFNKTSMVRMPPINIDPDLVDDGRHGFMPGVGRVRTGPRNNGYWESRECNRSSSFFNDGLLDSYRPPYGHNYSVPSRSRSLGGTSFPPSWEREREERRLREQHLASQEASQRESGAQDFAGQPSGRLDSAIQDTAVGESGNICPESSTVSGYNHTDVPATVSAINDTDTSDFLHHTQLLNQLLADAQANRSSDDACADDVFDYRDSRRSDEHLPRRRNIKQEPVEDRRGLYRDTRRSSTSTAPCRRIKQEEEENSMFFVDTRTGASSSSEPSGYDADSSNGDRRTDSTLAATPPFNLPPPIARPAIPGTCMWPVDLECPARADHLIDCRTLVVEWKRWATGQAEGDVEVIPEDVDPASEPFATLHEASRIFHLINNISWQSADSNALKYTFTDITVWIVTMSTKSITEADLHASVALPILQAFLSAANAPNRTAKRVPITIEEDLTYLMRKWEFGDLSQLPRRGLIRRSQRGPYYPDPNWPYRRDNAKFFGHGHLVNGQKWNTRAAMARDGAHGPLIAGISGSKRRGAYSVVMGYHDTYKHDCYADIDCGNRIFYLSTALPKPEAEVEVDENGNVQPAHLSNYRDDGADADIAIPDPDLATSGAQALMKSSQTGEPVRVFRSFKASRICSHRKKKAYRYDGLYQVVDYVCLKPERQIYRFEMVRLDHGQGPIRSGVPAEPISGRERMEIRAAR